MADIRNDFVGIKSPNPFWLASAPPTDKEYNVRRAFEAGWGGVVWKTLGLDGPPIVNVNGPRYGVVYGADRRRARDQQYRADHRSPTADEPRRDQGGQTGLSRPRRRHLADGAMRGTLLEGHSRPGRGDRLRRRRAQFRLSRTACPSVAWGRPSARYLTTSRWSPAGARLIHRMPVIVKLTPNITDIRYPAQRREDAAAPMRSA